MFSRSPKSRSLRAPYHSRLAAANSPFSLAPFITVNYTSARYAGRYYVVSNPSAGRAPGIQLSVSLSSFLSDDVGLSFVVTGSSRSSSSAAFDLASLSPSLFLFSFLRHRLHIIPPPHLVRGRPFSSSIFVRSSSPLVENRCYYLPGLRVGGAGRRGEPHFFFPSRFFYTRTVRFGH